MPHSAVMPTVEASVLISSFLPLERHTKQSGRLSHIAADYAGSQDRCIAHGCTLNSLVLPKA